MAPDAGEAVESGAETHVRTNRCSNSSDTPERPLDPGGREKLGSSLYTPSRCIVIHMSRTNIDIDDELIHRVMVRYHLTTKREAVDYALRSLAGQPMTRAEMLDFFGAFPDFEAPADSPAPDARR